MPSTVSIPAKPEEFRELSELIAVRVHADVKARFARAVKGRGFRSVSEYLRQVVELEINQSEQAQTEAA